VVIDEAIEVAKKFGGEESGQFVNGVLDAVRKKLDPAPRAPRGRSSSHAKPS
jgi:N utilization substance protein B